MKEQRGHWVFLGFAGFLSLAMVVGLGREQHWGERSQEVQLVAPTAAGLRTGIDVRISGLPVGQVVGLEMEPNASVRVRMKVFESYRRLIGSKSVVSRGVDGFVGDHFIAISPDPSLTSGARWRG
jgi:phospholipid/cholesterol/gamma-HCH transport system substrate-binding protein